MDMHPIFAFDVVLANLLVTLRTPTLTHVLFTVTLLGSLQIVVFVAICASGILIQSREKAFVIGLWVSLFASQSVTWLGKVFFARSRPGGLIPLYHEASYSFPSGHATSAVALYGFIAYLLLRFETAWMRRAYIAIGAVLVIGLIDFSRLYLGVHYFSDVLAGDLVGWIALLFSISLAEWIRDGKKGHA